MISRSAYRDGRDPTESAVDYSQVCHRPGSPSYVAPIRIWCLSSQNGPEVHDGLCQREFLSQILTKDLASFSVSLAFLATEDLVHRRPERGGGPFSHVALCLAFVVAAHPIAQADVRSP